MKFFILFCGFLLNFFPLIKQIIDKYFEYANEIYQCELEPFEFLNELHLDYFCKIMLKLLHLLQISALNIMLFCSVSLKCTMTILKYASNLIKYEFYSLDLTGLCKEDDPIEKLKEILNEYINNGLKLNKNAVLFINLNEIKENSDINCSKYEELFIVLNSLEKNYEAGDIFLKNVVEEYLQNCKLSDNYKNLNSYHHLHILKEKLASKIRYIFNMDVNHFLKHSLKHQCSNVFLANYHDFFKNYTKLYIYIKNSEENLGENETFSKNMEKIHNFYKEKGEFLKNVKIAYVFEIEESKIILKETKSFNNPLSFQQFFTLTCYTYEKIRMNLANKFEKEKKSGIMGKIFDLEKAKFEKFNKEVNKILGKKEKFEKDLIENEEKKKHNSMELLVIREEIERINDEISGFDKDIKVFEEGLIEEKKGFIEKFIEIRKDLMISEEEV